MDLSWLGLQRERDDAREGEVEALRDVNSRLVGAHRRALDDAAELRREADRLREENVALRELLRVERQERRRRRSHYERLLEAARSLGSEATGSSPTSRGDDDAPAPPSPANDAVAEAPATAVLPATPEGAVVIDLAAHRREPEPLVLDVTDERPTVPATVSWLRR